jgi:PAS domain S-box-containing protein
MQTGGTRTQTSGRTGDAPADSPPIPATVAGRRRRGASVAVYAVLLMGLGLTAAVTHLTRAEIRAAAQEQFTRLAERITAEIERRANIAVFGLRGLRGFYAGSKSVERLEFRTFVASHDLHNEYPGVLGFGFVQRVLRPDLDGFVAAERADDAPDFAVSTSGTGDDLYVIKFIEPLWENRVSLGFDMGSEPVRREALERATRTGELTSTGRIALVQDAQKRAGFLYLLPVYRNGSAPQTPEERQAALVGLVYAPIIADEVFAGLGEGADGKIDVDLFDGEKPDESCTLLDTDARSRLVEETGERVARPEMFQQLRHIAVGGRTWSLLLSTTPGFEAGLDGATPAILGCSGVLLTALVVALTWSLGSGRERALLLAQSMTADLASAKLAAEHALREFEALRHTVDKHSCVSIADASGSIIDVNESFCRVSGYTREELIGQDHRLFNSGHHPKHFWAEMWAAIIAGRPWRGEVCNRAKDGSRYWVDSIVAPFADAGGKIEKYVSIRHDITERKRAQSHLAEAQRLESVGQLAAGIAHEINTPTQFVSDNTRFLQSSFPKLQDILARYRQLLETCRVGPVPPDLLNALEAATGGTKLDYLLEQIPEAIADSLEGLARVAKIVRAMKDFAHPGQQSMSPADLNHAIESTVTVARNEWKYVAELTLDLDPALPRVSCLLGDFNQAILNIVVNAAHAVKDVAERGTRGRGTIAISTRRDGDQIEVRIRDTGTGIPVEHRDKIFNHFFTTKEVGRGTGQGLAIARRTIVEKHHGTLTFETEVGRGTTFIIRLPIEPDTLATTEKPKHEPSCLAG